MNRSPKILLVVAIALFVAGLGLAVTQPGDLGDDDETAALDTSTTTTSLAPSSTVAIGSGDTSTTAPGTEQTTTTAPGDPATPTTAAPTTVAPLTTTAPTTAPAGTAGSGVGAVGGPAPADTADGLAATGAESLLLAGLAVGATGLVLQRRKR